MRLSILWWLAFLPLLPVLWVQGQYARRRTPRLPEASGDAHGLAGREGKVFRLAVLGESPVAGVGVEHYNESLSAGIARALSESLQCAVQWMAVGENGIDIGAACGRLAPRLAVQRPDLVIVALGVNDTTRLTTRPSWRRGIRKLVSSIRVHTRAPILFAPVPPMASFTALPQPLRTMLGWRAELLDRDLDAVCRKLPGVRRALALPPLEGRHLSLDGYHPSAAACVEWGSRLARELEGDIEFARLW